MTSQSTSGTSAGGEAMQRPPVGVIILALLHYAVGLYLFVGSFFGLYALWLGPYAVVFWGVNAIFLILGYGLGRLRNWARWMQIVLSTIGAVGFPLITIDMLRDGVAFGSAVPVGFGFTVTNVVIILYLLRPQVKQVFGASSHSGGGPEVQKVSEP